MKKKTPRRSFLKQMAVGSTSAAFLPTALLPGKEQPSAADTSNDQYSPGARNYNGPYKGEYLNRVAMPMGGLGAGMICMEGLSLIHI